MERYRKFIVAGVGAVVSLVPIVWPGNSTAQQVLQVLIAVATAFGVYAVKNEDA